MRNACFRICVLLGVCPAISAGAEKWTMQFFHDVVGSHLTITGFTCPSAKRCIAAGIIEEKNRTRGTAVVTSDGGLHWANVDIGDPPLNLFFLNDTTGWIATNKGIWRTDESGRAWKKLASLEGVESMYFLTADHGFAVGAPNMVQETRDGGRHWSRINTGDPNTGEGQDTVFDCVAFIGLRGLIVGSAHRRTRWLPAWADVDRSRNQRQGSETKIVLDTFDGGKTWVSHTYTQLGDPEELLFTRQGDILVLTEFHDAYEVPSAVYRLERQTDESRVIYREKGHAITDIAALPDGRIFLAGVDLPGQSNQVLIPGRLRILRGDGADGWTPMAVDYRAVARRVMLAAADTANMWVATDTGMILKLAQKP